LAGNLVVVTNAEPTAHVSTGGYLKSVFELDEPPAIGLWHNRYVPTATTEFDPRDVVGNYNRNVPDELRISEASARCIDNLSFVPQDSSLDLLRGNPSILINVYRRMLDMVELIQEQRLTNLLHELDLSGRSFDLMRYYLLHNRAIDDVEEYTGGLGDYLGSLLNHEEGKSPLSDPDALKAVSEALQSIKSDTLRDFLLSLELLLEEAIERQEESRRPFAAGTPVQTNKLLDRRITRLLVFMNRASEELGGFLRNSAGVLMVYFSLYKLLQSRTIVKLIADFVPKRRNARGNRVRDRHAQIRNLVEGDREYRSRFFALVRTLYPIFNKQVATMVQTFDLRGLLLTKASGEVNREAYLKLLVSFLHDTINCGLSVIVGFSYRPASTAFQQGADKLLERIDRAS
jgi:flagellar biosynthesis protein FlhG